MLATERLLRLPISIVRDGPEPSSCPFRTALYNCATEGFFKVARQLDDLVGKDVVCLR